MNTEIENPCPWCGKEVEISAAASFNVTQYQTSAIAKAFCCGNLLKLYPVSAVHITKCDESVKVDDWGYPRTTEEHDEK